MLLHKKHIPRGIPMLAGPTITEEDPARPPVVSQSEVEIDGEQWVVTDKPKGTEGVRVRVFGRGGSCGYPMWGVGL